MRALGFRVQGLGFKLCDLGLRVLGFRIEVLELTGLELMVSSFRLGFRSHAGFSIYRVIESQDLGFRPWSFRQRSL